MEPMGLEFGASIKRQRMSPMCDRVMLYVRQESEDIYTPLHVVPPTTTGLLNAVSALTTRINAGVKGQLLQLTFIYRKLILCHDTESDFVCKRERETHTIINSIHKRHTRSAPQPAHNNNNHNTYYIYLITII